MEKAANDNRGPSPSRHRARRAPLVERKHAERRRARGRMDALTVVPLTVAQLRHDALPSPHGGVSRRALLVAVFLVGSVGVHVLVVGAGFVVGGRDRGRREVVRQEVKIEIAEKKVEPPPPPVEKPPEPQRRLRVPPKVIEPTKPPETKAPPSRAPVRVVGLSLESTVEGGGGPSFAVGNTREGKTAEKARAPAEIPTQAPPVADEESKINRAAARIPVAGVKYEQPKRRRPITPPYPDTLKSQGIEADVTVMLSLDETGKVKNVKIIRESPYPEFNEVARQTALHEEFEPATRDGVPIPFSISFTYRFRLEDE